MFCNKCGATLKDGSLFCNKCGNRISKAAQPVQPEDDRTVGIIYPDQNNPVQSEYIAPEPVIKDAAPEPLGIEPEPSGILAEQQEPAYSDGFPVLDQAVNETAAPQTPVYDAGNNMYQQGGWQNTPEPYYDQQPQQPQVSPAPGFYGQARQPNMNIPGQQDIPGPAAYAAAPRNEKAAVRNRKGDQKWRFALTVIFGILLTIVMVAFITWLSLITKVNRDTLGGLLEETKVSDIVLSDSAGREKDLVEYIEDKTDFKIGDYFDITDEDLRKVLNTDVVKEFVQQNFGTYFDYILNGGKTPEGISKDTVIEFVNDHKEEILKQFNKGKKTIVEEEDIEQFANRHSEDLDKLFESIDESTEELSIDWVKDQSGVNLKTISSLMSILKWVIIGAFAFLVLMILLVNLWKISQGLKGISVSCIFAGVITGSFGAALILLYDASETNLIRVILMPVVWMMLILGVSFLVGGIIFLTLVSIIKNIKNKRRA